MTDTLLHSELKAVSKRCQQVYDLLAFYYGWKESPPLYSDFILEWPGSPLEGKVIFAQTSRFDDFQISIALGKDLLSNLKSNQVNLNSLAVLAEEVSHFHLLCEAAASNCQVSRMEIEVLGEIDRFLYLLHAVEIENISQLCDLVFENENRFSDTPNAPLYQEAENRAYLILKEVFSLQWNNSRFDFSRRDAIACQRLQNFRNRILLPRAA